jgi:DHA2 family methylenomycin A resistance protein-like MFS transporter
MAASRFPLALTGLSLGYFMVLFDTTALTVALPGIARDLGSGVQGLAWVTDGYTLTFAGCLLAAGVLADRHGAERTFLAGLAGFGVLSPLCAAAPSTVTLVAARGALGVAGALLLPASLSLIAGLYPDPARRSRAIGAWASISGSALAAGPLLGGALVAATGWRGIFAVNAPVALAAALLVRGRLPAAPRRAARVDARGQALVLVAVTAFTWALIGASALLLAVAVLAGVLALRTERASADPAVPPGLFKAQVVTAALVGGLVVGGTLAAELFLTTLQLQQVRGLGPVLTGVAFLPLTVPMVLNPAPAARLVARVGPARPVLGGLMLITGATVVLAYGSAGASYAWVAAGLALLGFGISFTLPALTSAVVLAAPDSATGAAGGLFSVVRQTGATIGVAAGAAIIGSDVGHAQRGHALLAIAAAAAAVVWRVAGARLVTPETRSSHTAGR